MGERIEGEEEEEEGVKKMIRRPFGSRPRLDDGHRLCVKKKERERRAGRVQAPFKRSRNAAASMSLGLGSYLASGDSRRSGTGRPELEEEAEGWGFTRSWEPCPDGFLTVAMGEEAARPSHRVMRIIMGTTTTLLGRLPAATPTATALICKPKKKSPDEMEDNLASFLPCHIETSRAPNRMQLGAKDPHDLITKSKLFSLKKENKKKERKNKKTPTWNWFALVCHYSEGYYKKMMDKRKERD